jgi:hypothetical protein
LILIDTKIRIDNRSESDGLSQYREAFLLAIEKQREKIAF